MDIVDGLKPIAHRNTSQSVIGRIVLAATVYYIWQERNNQLYKRVCKPVDKLVELIYGNVWLN